MPFVILKSVSRHRVIKSLQFELFNAQSFVHRLYLFLDPKKLFNADLISTAFSLISFSHCGHFGFFLEVFLTGRNMKELKMSLKSQGM